MRVLFDYQAVLRTRYGGIPRYFIELLSQFNSDKDVEAIYPKSYCRNIDFREIFIPNSNSLRYRLSDFVVDSAQKYLHVNPAKYLSDAYSQGIKLLDSRNYDIFHPMSFEPYFYKHLHNKPLILTLHDISAELYPELYGLEHANIKNVGISINYATRFIANSEYTKKQFVEYYDIDNDLIDVVYLGYNPLSPVKRDTLFESHHSYILFVCSGRKGNKNVHSWLGIVRNILISYNINVVFAGGGPISADEKAFFKNIGLLGRIIQKNVNDSELYILYQNALALVFPSINEGFGIPILEAFSCGCPVLCSNTSSLPEVGGDAALYFSPKDIMSVRESLLSIICDEKLRERMRERGYKQLEKFSWKKCAEETKKVYDKVL